MERETSHRSADRDPRVRLLERVREMHRNWLAIACRAKSTPEHSHALGKVSALSDLIDELERELGQVPALEVVRVGCTDWRCPSCRTGVLHG